ASESEWGRGANATKQKNPLSIMGAGPLQVYPSIEEGLDKGAKNLYDLYISEGLTTPEKIGPKYAPVGASNDPDDLNSNWVPTVKKIMKSFGGKEAKCSTESSGGGSDGKGFDFKGEFPKP
ncbi:TPA: glucosaminidase domain-containing protein, partial [Staphylococcus aureus]|nr:glucosaminidase domain-containing protein [Staphylococcus aureus]